MSDLTELDKGVEIFANWQTVLFCTAIYLITQLIRTLVENLPRSKKFSEGWVWKTVLLPFGPIGTGVGLIFICKQFPWPLPVANILSAKIMYGAACGVGCGWMFARIREWFGVAADSNNPLMQRLGSKVTKRGASSTPPSNAFGPKPKNKIKWWGRHKKGE